MHAVCTVRSERSNVAARIAYDDLRGWIDQARRFGEVKEASGLIWQQDIGMLSEIALHDDSAGSRVLVNFFGGKQAIQYFSLRH